MANEVKHRKKNVKKEEVKPEKTKKEGETPKNEEKLKKEAGLDSLKSPLSTSNNKLAFLWYLISPIFAAIFTLKADQLLDHAISRTQSQS